MESFKVVMCKSCSRIRKEAGVAKVGGQGESSRRRDKQIGGEGSLEEIVVLSKYCKHLSIFIMLQKRKRH